ENTIGAVVCDMTDVRESDGYVALATHAGGIYTTHITSVNDIVTVRELDAANLFSLNVFPNPATDQVTVSYSLSGVKDVEITLMDELGRVVRIDSHGKKAAGEYTAQISLSSFARGVYYIRVKAGEAVETKTVIIR
ncbi:MAG TPA: T9SS type A sorting domain-containing protein, partial [Bacteroidia bacterium]|nr:T9SS type A sorting domain-containing protein [Bacteroidia bacterium]